MVIFSIKLKFIVRVWLRHTVANALWCNLVTIGLTVHSLWKWKQIVKKLIGKKNLLLSHQILISAHQNHIHRHVCSNLCNGPVRTPAAYEEQASKTVERLVVGVWDHLLLWGLLIKPWLPLFLITTYLKWMCKHLWLRNTQIQNYSLYRIWKEKM